MTQMDTITLCVLIALGGAVIMLVGMSFRSWRDASRSAYYFQRKQSVSKMQSYALTSIALCVLLFALVTFVMEPEKTNIALVRVISNGKPAAGIVQPSQAQTIIQATVQDEADVYVSDVNGQEASMPMAAIPIDFADEQESVLSIPDVVLEESDKSIDNDNNANETADLIQDTPTNEQNEQAQEINEPEAVVESGRSLSAEIANETANNNVAETVEQVVEEVEEVVYKEPSISNIVFTTAIDGNFTAIEANSTFGSGYYRLYATFSYENMSRGTPWSWAWTQNGTVVGSGQKTWTDNDTGQGYVYFEPSEGLSVGGYQLQIWVNNSLVDSNSMTVVSNVAQ